MTERAPDQLSFFRVFPSIMLPMFLAAVDQTIVATALPAIVASTGEAERASWVVVAYLIASTVAAPVYGRLGDEYGRRRLMIVGLAVFIAASMFCALAHSIEVLAAARVLQGLGGGGLMTLSQALIGETIPPRERARYQGYLAGVGISANAFGPVAGGFLAQHFGWQSIFLINLPLGLLAAALTLRLPSLPHPSGRFQVDVLGIVLFAGLVAPLILALERAQHLDPAALPTILGLAALAIFALLLLIRREQQAASPLLPLTLLRQATIWRSDALAACHGAALVSLITFMPIYLIVVRGISPAQTGLLLLPLMIGIGIGSMATGRMVTKSGRTAIFPSYGLILVTLNLLLLALVAPWIGIASLALVFFWNGLCMGTVMGVVQVTVQSASGPQFLGEAAASVQFSRSVGAAFGTATVATILFAVLAATDPETAKLFAAMMEQGAGVLSSLSPAQQAVVQGEIAQAFRSAFLVIAGFAGTGAVLAMTIPLRKIEK
ncbi:MAG TPA: MFS transporter [Xanthobacteraceae bacterium]|nr:MFS transporter [Xanthobacteraceae bacterium]